MHMVSHRLVEFGHERTIGSMLRTPTAFAGQDDDSINHAPNVQGRAHLPDSGFTGTANLPSGQER